jgi:hypothetical protein
VNVSVTVQEAFGASELPQVVAVMAKAVGLLPPSTGLPLMVRVAVPVLVSVRVCGALVDPEAALKAERVETERAGAVTGVLLGFPPPLHPVMRVKQKAMTASGRRLRSMGDLNSDGLGKPPL